MDIDHDIPINVVIIPNLEQDEQELIDTYVDIICSCRKRSEVRPAIQMIVDEIKELNTKQIFVRLTQNMAELLDNKNL